MGLRVHCERYKTVPSKQSKTGRALRCADMRKNTRRGPQSPVCDRRLVGGGRSKGLLRPVGCRRVRTRKMIRLYGNG
jgi:hypothetical protein